jgi:hypothetical protein
MTYIIFTSTGPSGAAACRGRRHCSTFVVVRVVVIVASSSCSRDGRRLAGGLCDAVLGADLDVT